MLIKKNLYLSIAEHNIKQYIFSLVNFIIEYVKYIMSK